MVDTAGTEIEDFFINVNNFNIDVKKLSDEGRSN